MCGFAGFTLTDEAAFDKKEVLSKMTERISHRGPDNRGSFIEEHAALGFCRLSIIDIEGGNQPMVSADNRFVILYNGEVYNFRELRKELSEAGVEFKTDCDTEVVLNAVITWGKEAVKRFRGMFSFVIYDREKETLFGARDPFGIKPFYYYKSGGSLLFGSEIKAFLPHPCFHRELDPEVLKMYLVFQYSPMEKTIFKNVYKLLPGSMLTWEKGVLKTQKYFDPLLDPVPSSMKAAAARIDEVMADSAQHHLISDVEVGAFQSGGVDSSYVISLSKPQKTYSVGFGTEGFDETKLAKEFCIGTEIINKAREITPDGFFAALPMVQYYSDEPHANLSAVPLYYLAQLASKDVKVVLSGEGADEFFGGYDWYIEGKASALYRKLPLNIRKKAAVLFKHAPARLEKFFAGNALETEETYIGQAFIMDDEEADGLLKEKYRTAITFRDVTRPYFEKVKGCDDLTKKLYLDMNLWLPGDILLKADKMTMAHSLELRVPYLDKEVWEAASRLPSRLKQNGRHTKPALRKAANSRIPAQYAKRKKAGFMVPFREWLKEDKYYNIVKEALSGDTAREFFDTEKLLSMLKDHRDGKKNNARVIYTVYSFIIWYDIYFNGREPASEQHQMSI